MSAGNPPKLQASPYRIARSTAALSFVEEAIERPVPLLVSTLPGELGFAIVLGLEVAELAAELLETGEALRREASASNSV